jgi:hypothetical protein
MYTLMKKLNLYLSLEEPAFGAGSSACVSALARLRYRRHIVFGFSLTFGLFTLPSAHCIRFFTYIWFIYVTVGTLYSVFRIHLAYYVTVGTLYSVFRIHLARLRYRRHIVFGFSLTFGLFTLPSAHCIRFFAYICP